MRMERAAVIRNVKGEVIAIVRGKSKYTRIDLIELQGVLNGGLLVIKRGIVEMEAATDSTTVAYYFVTREVSFEARKMFEEPRKEAAKFEFFSLKHEYRETNRLANKLFSVRVVQEFVTYSNCGAQMYH